MSRTVYGGIAFALVSLLSGFAGDGASGDRNAHDSHSGVLADTIASVLSGEWGWITNGPGCRDNPHTISFTPDRRHMVVSYREPFDSSGSRIKRYEIRSLAAHSVRVFLVSPQETRRTPAGNAVVWDLVITAPDVYQWHRTDWPENGFTRAIIKCSGLRAPSSDPEGTARVFLEAMAAPDLVVAAELTDPAELRRNRLAFDSLLVADGTNYLSLRIFRLDSVAQLQRLTDTEFTARLFAFQSLSRTGYSFWGNVRGVDILGSTRSGPDTAHVVYRWRFPSDSLPMRSAQVTTMIRSGGRWWAQMLGDYRGLVASLKAPMVPVEPARPLPFDRRQ